MQFVGRLLCETVILLACSTTLEFKLVSPVILSPINKNVVLHFSAFMETGKFGRFKLKSSEGIHIWKVDVGILLRWKDATAKGSEEIGKLIQRGQGEYLGVEVNPNPSSQQTCSPAKADISSVADVPTTGAKISTFDVGSTFTLCYLLYICTSNG